MDAELLRKNIIHYSVLAKKYPTKACDEAGAGKNLISDLRDGKVPSVERVQKLAAYFGITTSELLGEELPGEPKLPAGMSPEAYTMGRKYDKASPRDRQLVDAILEPYEVDDTGKDLPEENEPDTVRIFRAAKSESNHPPEILDVPREYIEDLKKATPVKHKEDI